VHYHLACGPPKPGDHWQGWVTITVRADALRRLGLHPDQPTSAIEGPAAPAWWRRRG
jgi:hypothetical protein